MNDPHVVALYYSVKHAEQVNYNKAPRLDHDQPEVYTAGRERPRGNHHESPLRDRGRSSCGS